MVRGRRPGPPSGAFHDSSGTQVNNPVIAALLGRQPRRVVAEGAGGPHDTRAVSAAGHGAADHVGNSSSEASLRVSPAPRFVPPPPPRPASSPSPPAPVHALDVDAGSRLLQDVGSLPLAQPVPASIPSPALGVGVRREGRGTARRHRPPPPPIDADVADVAVPATVGAPAALPQSAIPAVTHPRQPQRSGDRSGGDGAPGGRRRHRARPPPPPLEENEPLPATGLFLRREAAHARRR